MSHKKFVSTCPLDCYDTCSMLISVDENDKAVSIEGNKSHPLTQGFICEKGRKHLERVYSPLRLKYPLKKLNGEWVRIQWDEALDTIAAKMKEYISTYGTKSIALYSYGGSNGLLKECENFFFDCFGDTTQFTGSLCCGAGIKAQNMDFGQSINHSANDMLNSQTIVIWGRNAAETNIHLIPFMKKAKEKGAKIIVIDPIRTDTAKLGYWHLQVLPGGDCALACAAAKYIIENELYDRDFTKTHTEGFNDLIDYLNSISYESLSEKCGIKVDDISTFARIIAENKPTSFHIGIGLQRYLFGGTAIRSIDMLAALSGNIGIKGGGANYSNSVFHSNLNWKALGINTNQNRYIVRAQMGKGLKEAIAPPVKMIIISRSNPLLQNPNSNEVADALSGIDFKVSIEHFMTDTASQCDMVLPASYFLEEEDIIASELWSGYIHYNKPCIPPYYESKSEVKIYSELAKRLNIESFPQMDEQQWIELLLKQFVENGLDMKKLREEGFVRNPFDIDIPWKDKQFATDTGKMKLLEPDKLNSYFSESQKNKEPYRLLTIHSKKTLHSQHMLDVESDIPLVHISQIDADEIDIENGEAIRLYNHLGEVKAKTYISDNCQKGVLYMYEGWWQKNGGSVNKLTDDKTSDIGLQAVFNECRCNIEKSV